MSLLYTAPSPACEQDHRERNDDRGVREDVARARVERRFLDISRLTENDGRLKQVALRDHPPVRIDDAADAGIRGAHEIPSCLNRARRRLCEVLDGAQRRSDHWVVVMLAQEQTPARE